MPGRKDGKEKQALAAPDTVSLTTQERVELIARLITEKIAEDEANGFVLLRKIKERYGKAA